MLIGVNHRKGGGGVDGSNLKEGCGRCDLQERW